MTGQKLEETKNQLENELTRLEKLCQTEEAQEKIALIAAGILFKNLKTEQKYETAKKLVSDLSEKSPKASPPKIFLAVSSRLCK